MLKLDQENKVYTLVEYTDILNGLSFANKGDNEEINKLLNELFIDSEQFDVYQDNKHYVKLKTDSKIVTYLKEEVKVLDYDNFVDHNILEFALMRSFYEFNHEMNKKLKIYFRKYMDNEIKGIENDIIKNEIINDKILFEYIKEYENLDEYLKVKINRNIDINNEVKGKYKSMVG